MRVLVMGANGKTGFLTVEMLLEHGEHTPVAMIRDDSQRERFARVGVETVAGDLEHPVDHAVAGCDAVIFAAGSGSQTGKDKTVLVDHLGGIRAAVAAGLNGVRRFIMLSSLNARIDSQSRIKHYHRAKAAADSFIMDWSHVLDEPLDWTIVCPGRLSDEAGSGSISVSTDIDGKGVTSRANVANTMVACLDSPKTIKKRFAVLDGDTAIKEALSSIG